MSKYVDSNPYQPPITNKTMKEESYKHIKAVTNKIIKAMKDCALGSIVDFEAEKISMVTPEKARKSLELTLAQMTRNIIKIERK